MGDLIRLELDPATMLSRISSFNLSRRFKEHPVFSILRSSFDSMLEKDQLLFLDVALRFLPSDFKCSSSEWLGMVHGKDRHDKLVLFHSLGRVCIIMIVANGQSGSGNQCKRI